MTVFMLGDLTDGKSTALTDFQHPQPQLAQTQTSIINYKRNDGIDLNAKLYLPAGYDPVRFEWDYPDFLFLRNLIC